VFFVIVRIMGLVDNSCPSSRVFCPSSRVFCPSSRVFCPSSHQKTALNQGLRGSLKVKGLKNKHTGAWASPLCVSRAMHTNRDHGATGQRGPVCKDRGNRGPSRAWNRAGGQVRPVRALSWLSWPCFAWFFSLWIQSWPCLVVWS